MSQTVTVTSHVSSGMLHCIFDKNTRQFYVLCVVLGVAGGSASGTPETGRGGTAAEGQRRGWRPGENVSGTDRWEVLMRLSC